MTTAKKSRRSVPVQRSPWVMPLLVATSFFVGSFIAFGNPTLWQTDAQRRCPLCVSVSCVGESAHDQTEEASTDTDDSFGVISWSKTTSGLDDEGRAKNLMLAAEAVDGTVLEPGDVFSFNTVVGDTGHDDRYSVAPIVADSDLEAAQGGGICQLSTTLYLAALEADLTIVERHPHTILVDYAPLGLDATVEYGAGLDLKFKNTSAHPILIRARANGQSTSVEILGQPLVDGITIKAGSTIERLFGPGGVEYPADTFDLRGSAGIHVVVNSFLEYFKEGQLIKTKSLGSDTYLIVGYEFLDTTAGGGTPLTITGDGAPVATK